VKGNIVARGSRILTTTGFDAGTVEDVMFDGESGILEGVETSRGWIAGDRLEALGSYASCRSTNDSPAYPDRGRRRRVALRCALCTEARS